MDSIEKLAQLEALKKSGAISEDEFAEQKRKLLGSPEAKKKNGWTSWRSPKAWILAGVILVGYVTVKVGMAEPALPSCGDKQVTGMVVEAVNNQILSNPFARALVGNVRLISVGQTKELHSDQAIRACEGVVKRNDGEGGIGYTIEWQSKEKGTFYVQPIDIDVMHANYAKAESVKGEVKPDAAKAEAPAPVKQTAFVNPLKKSQWLSEGYTVCVGQSHDIDAATNCATTEDGAQESELVIAFNSLLFQSPDASHSKINEEQKNWEADSIASCNKLSQADPAMAKYLSASCLAESKIKRRSQIESLLKKED